MNHLHINDIFYTELRLYKNSVKMSVIAVLRKLNL